MTANARQEHDDRSGIEAKVEYLKQPEAYPGGAQAVDVVQTHMAYVFLTEQLAYKLKKPVRYNYLDFSTIEARRRDCEDEVRLNRRLAPDVYYGVVPLVIDRQGAFSLEPDSMGEGQIVDWLVKMRRLPSDRMLDRAIAEHTVEEPQVRAAASRLARFYRDAQAVAISAAEYRQRLADSIRENYGELSTPAYHCPVELIELVTADQVDFLRRRSEWVDARVDAGKIIEAHGDLRPEHICLEVEPVIIDCLEFHRDFRLLDPASELNFLALECERSGAPYVGNWFWETYQQWTGDQPPKELLRFYWNLHACTRAKIALWHLKDSDVHHPEKWLQRAQWYLRSAREIAEAVPQS